jgi:hypothetical protein
MVTRQRLRVGRGHEGKTVTIFVEDTHFRVVREATGLGLPVSAVSKWYHRRAIHLLKTCIPNIGPFYGISWEPVYAERLVTRDQWPQNPDGARRVIREWEEVRRRVAEGDLADVVLIDGAWQ